MHSDDQSTNPTPAPVPKKKRWPRNVAIGLALTAVLAGGALYYGSRETTLQLVAQKIANASGGKLTLSGVTGSLYGRMHIAHAVFRTPEQVLTLDNIDIDWSPRQALTGNIAIDQLYVASLRSETLKESPPSPMPTSLRAPFDIDVGDARITKVVLVSKGAATEIDNIKFKLKGDKQQWQLRDASAATPFGLVAANASIGASRPFKLGGAASLTQSKTTAGAVATTAAQINLTVGGDLNLTLLDATARAGRAVGDGHFALAPYAAIPLREVRLNGKNVDPGFFNPSLPTADLSFAIAGKVDDNRNVSGTVNIVNDGPAGALDQQRLPLRTMRGQVGGNLNDVKIADVLVDFGDAGKFTGSGGVQRKEGDAGLPSADFTLHTDRLDVKQLYSSVKTTKIAGDITVSNKGDTQTLVTSLVDAGLKLTASASLKNNLLTLTEARLAAGASSVKLDGTLNLNQEKPFNINASASKFNPASFGDYPQADLNADIHSSGVLAARAATPDGLPSWRVAADFALRPSRLFNQALSGKGKLNADATHISGIDAALALGQNKVALNGSFGAPGEKLNWRVAASDLSVARGDLYGAIEANGVVTGTMKAPRTSFTADARGLGWAPSLRRTTDSVLHASGEAWLGANGPEVKATGTAQRFNPAAFGAPLAGSINGAFDASGRGGANWAGAVNLALQPSTLGKSPLTGYARLAADRQHVSNADVDLHVGPNVVAAKGNFGRTGDKLDWRIDAPQLAAFGPDFAGMLRGSGTVSGTMQAPSLAASLDGQNIRAMGKISLTSVKGTASLGTGHGAADPMVSDIALTDFASGDTKIAAARLVTTGTRGAHTVKLTARADTFDANVEVRGGWKGDAWTGAVAALQNRGLYAVTLQAPVPLSLTTAPGTGVAGLASPQRIDLGNAVLALANGSVNIQSLSKNGGHWASRGAATGVPLTYLAKLSPTLGETLSGSLTLGAQWGLDLQAAAAGGIPALNGNVRAFREAGDLVVGSDTPVILGLSKLEARADVASGALRMQLDVSGTRLGSARVDATAQMIKGMLGNDSPLRLTANADMGSIAWMAPLIGTPGVELDGALKLALTGAGTIGTPTLNGNINGDNMTVRWADQGLRLRNGQLRAQLAGDQLLLQRLAFDGASGNAVANGDVRFAGGEATAHLKLVANKLEVLSRPDRTLIVSGESTLVRDAKTFELDGKFKADRALLELAPLGRPTISDDVVVLGRSNVAPQKAEPSKPLTVDVSVDMGDDFHLRGMGADAYLAGSARVRMSGGRPPRVNGSISVNNGTYAAYGQKLTIERGVLTFSGPYDNPSLNILAVRKRPEGEQLTETNVEAGVEVRGTALAPSAKLVSTPTVPDSEKLSWLVLGHGMEGSTGNEAGVLSAAAGALLGGAGGTGGIQSKIANSLGLDELGVSQASGTAPGLESTVVTVGKRISSRLYVTFEQGAATTSSLVKLRYKINPRLSVQVATGTNTALDLLYTWAFD